MEESNHKPNKIWVDKGSDCYNRSMKSWLEENNIEMCSTHNEEKSVIAERLIRAKKIKVKKKTHILTLVKKLIIKIQNSKLVVTLKYQIIKTFLQKVTLLIKKVKHTVPLTYVINDLNGEKMVGTFYQQKKKSRIENVIKRKGDRLYV